MVGAGFSASDFIPVAENTKYIFKTARHLAFYDKDKKYISGLNIGGPAKSYKITTPANCAFARFSWYDGWTAAKYRTGDEYLGGVYPFYNPATKDFDIAYYLEGKQYQLWITTE